MPRVLETAATVDELIKMLKEELDSPELRDLLVTAGFTRRVDLTLFLDRGRVAKPPRLVIE